MSVSGNKLCIVAMTALLLKIIFEYSLIFDSYFSIREFSRNTFSSEFVFNSCFNKHNPIICANTNYSIIY